MEFARGIANRIHKREMKKKSTEKVGERMDRWKESRYT